MPNHVVIKSGTIVLPSDPPEGEVIIGTTIGDTHDVIDWVSVRWLSSRRGRFIATEFTPDLVLAVLDETAPDPTVAPTNLHPSERAALMGHDVVSDPPFFSAGERWTCKKCGHAVIRYERNVYGSAIEVRCPGESQ